MHAVTTADISNKQLNLIYKALRTLQELPSERSLQPRHAETGRIAICATATQRNCNYVNSQEYK